MRWYVLVCTFVCVIVVVIDFALFLVCGCVCLRVLMCLFACVCVRVCDVVVYNVYM